ncbi:DUF6384 family protein [Pseudomonas sp. H9]|uniref:DUF6384 family protein n=1 Tax=Pseudomonas sp. H9 TaxID=483968 RepID=UPI001057F0F4|nr:DUF6384 family protein [Pseudomonas sp. H9]TDF78366.1 hypothetical protein E1573_23905 [Pseudomonas sp. H9]
MRKVPLSEKVGALAVVDELRRQQMEVQEHLDLPKRRAEIAASIRNYYQSHDIAFDDELIDQGVREFFSQRLVFEQPALSWSDRLLCRWLLRRDKPERTSPAQAKQRTTSWWSKHWMTKTKDVFVASVIISNVLLISRCSMHVNDRMKAEDAIETFSSLGRKLSDYRQWHRKNPGVPVSPELSDSLIQYQKLADLIGLQAYKSEEFSLRQQSQKDLVDDKQKRLAAETQLQHIQQNLDEIKSIFDARLELSKTLEQPFYEKAAWQFSVITQQTEKARKAIEAINTQGYTPARNEINQLYKLLDEAKQLQNVIQSQATFDRRARQLKLSGQDARQLQALSMRVSNAVGAFSATDATHLMGRFERTVEFAEQPLTLDIVDKDGIRPAIERCDEQTSCNLDDDSTQGKRWYAIVESRDALGKWAYTSILDPDTGEWRSHESFGIQISHAEYLRIKEDRLSDGQVDNRKMGYKAANALSMTFNNRVVKNADLILTW